MEVLEAQGGFRRWAGCFAFTERSGKGKAGDQRDGGLGCALSSVSDVADPLTFFVLIPPQLSC